jgi:hypothetical protein
MHIFLYKPGFLPTNACWRAIRYCFRFFGLRRRRFASGAKAFGFPAKKLCGANKEILDKESTIF